MPGRGAKSWPGGMDAGGWARWSAARGLAIGETVRQAVHAWIEPDVRRGSERARGGNKVVRVRDEYKDGREGLRFVRSRTHGRSRTAGSSLERVAKRMRLASMRERLPLSGVARVNCPLIHRPIARPRSPSRVCVQSRSLKENARE